MLDTTLATTFAVGTNVRGDVPGANWSFLLPTLRLERLVVVGSPTAAVLETLSQRGQRVIVGCVDARQARQVGALSEGRGLRNIEPLVLDATSISPLESESVDLVLLAGRYGTRQFKRDTALRRELRRLLKPEGLIYAECWRADALLQRAGFGMAQRFWMMPLMGEMHTALPVHDHLTTRYFVRHVLDTLPGKLAFLPQAGLMLLLRRYIARYGALAGDIAAKPGVSPPRYLCSIAQEAGLDITGHRWGLSAAGEFRSKKVLFFLFDGNRSTPTYIVKITRYPELNARLENQCRALDQLRALGFDHEQTLPRIAFFGYHADLAISGETAIAGVPFHLRSRGTADCPTFHAVLEWLIALGAATVEHGAVSSEQVADALQILYAQFTRIYQLEPIHKAFLERQIATIACSTVPFPLVFQHGDPGTWNVLITPRGDVALLDWEAAEPRGMPLWDLFYFMHAFATLHMANIDRRLPGIARELLAETRLSSVLEDVTEHYHNKIALDSTLIAPLFYTCWMHRALKEATRLVHSELEEGHFVNLLRHCIDHQSDSALQRLARRLHAVSAQQ